MFLGKTFARTKALATVLGVLALIACGCNREPVTVYGIIKWMREIQSESASVAPENGSALVVFVRPKDQLYMYQTGLFRVLAGGDPELIGLLAAGTRIGYQTRPGKHVFMTAGYGSTTEFLNAELLPDKTYYVLVNTWTNGWGTWRNMFKPVSPSGTSLTGLQEILKGMRVVEKVPDADAEAWLRNNMAHFRQRQAHYGEESYRIRTSSLTEQEGW